MSAQKSLVFFSRNTKQQVRDEVSQELRISTTEDLGKYLSMPTINGGVDRHTFKAISDRIESRLARWRTKVLSLARRATLIKSTISTISYYAMQTA